MIEFLLSTEQPGLELETARSIHGMSSAHWLAASRRALFTRHEISNPG